MASDNRTDTPAPLRVGLTGGIASGKSTVADMFAELGVPVIDTDVIARQVVMPGEPALDEIRESFGNKVFSADGTLDRALLRKLIFADERRRRTLEAILHPRIRTDGPTGRRCGGCLSAGGRAAARRIATQGRRRSHPGGRLR